MGSCVSLSISDQWMNKVCDWIDVKRGYIHNLEKNVTTLETSMGELKAKRDDLLRKVKREEDSGLQRLAEVQVWFTNAETIENRVNDLLSARNVEFQRLCLCGFCSKSLISSYRYGKSVFLALREVEKLKDSGDFNMIAEEAQTPEVEERPLQPIIVGQKEMLEKAWKHLLKDGVGIMELNVKKIVDEIAQKVRLRGEESEKRIDLYNFLRKKRFVLLLDDIWEKVDLAEIGVPFPTKENRCKLAFTTRSQDVCASMGVEDPMEVQCLVENEAFDLFEKKVGKKTLGSDPEIPDLAKKVAKKCRGLPLALNVIGETMSSKRTMEEWCNAVDVLNSYAIEFSGMEDQILPILKYSYDNLKDEHVKSCLLYCAIFPVDNIIRKKKLIDYWIGEGIIDVSGGLERGENKGYEIIGTLFRSSLLLEDVDVVCMHDVVREMALWIASDLGKQKEVFIVHAGVESHKMPKVKNWKVVKKMSLMQTKIDHLAGSPKCLELTTLLLQEGKVGNMSEFFNSMPKLVVLDLSKNPNLFELPEGISELVSLQYLNLSFTPIRLLPMGLRKLKKLIHLSLKGTSMLSSIDGISNLENLIVLKLDDYFAWDPKTVKELEILEHLEALNIGVSHLPFLEQYLSSFMLTSCTRLLEIRGIQLKSTGLSLPVTMEKLRVFRILRCSISEIKMVSLVQNPRNPCFSSLSNVSLQKCKFLRELTLLMFTPNLKDLDVSDSWKLEDIINKKKAYEGERSKKNRCRRIVPFQKLIYLRLANLPKLKNIYWRPLPFPRLKRINVDGCPNLKKLPLGSNSNMHGLIIRYTKKEWIEGVEWQDEATKTCFLPSCEQV